MIGDALSCEIRYCPNRRFYRYKCADGKTRWLCDAHLIVYSMEKNHVRPIKQSPKEVEA
jgi:hypothetical protein